MYLGSHPDNDSVDPFNCFPEDRYCSWMDKATYDTREDYRGVLRDINGDFPFSQPPLKVDKV